MTESFKTNKTKQNKTKLHAARALPCFLAYATDSAKHACATPTHACRESRAHSRLCIVRRDAFKDVPSGHVVRPAANRHVLWHAQQHIP